VLAEDRFVVIFLTAESATFHRRKTSYRPSGQVYASRSAVAGSRARPRQAARPHVAIATYGLSSTPFTIENTAVTAPIVSASVR
jgi:hypothetical protein